MSSHIDIELLSALIDGELDARDRHRLDDHMAGCAKCSQQFRLIETAAGQVGSLPLLEPDDLENQRLVRALVEWRKASEGPSGVKRPSLRSTPPRRWLAAGLVAAILAGFGLVQTLNKAGPIPGPPQVQAAGAPLELTSGRNIRSVVGALPQVRNQVGVYNVTTASRAANAAKTPQISSTAPEGSAGQDSVDASKALQSRRQAAPAAAPGGGSEPDGSAGGTAPAAGDAGNFGAPPPGSPQPQFSKAAGESCLEKVAATQPYTLVPLLARKADYQGKPAWVLAYAWTRSKDPKAKLDLVQVWIFDPRDCAALDGPALINRLLSYSSFAP